MQQNQTTNKNFSNKVKSCTFLHTDREGKADLKHSITYRIAGVGSLNPGEAFHVCIKHVHLLNQACESRLCGLTHLLVHTFGLGRRKKNNQCQSFMWKLPHKTCKCHFKDQEPLILQTSLKSSEESLQRAQIEASSTNASYWEHLTVFPSWNLNNKKKNEKKISEEQLGNSHLQK